MYTLLSCPLYFICVFRNEDQNVISPQLMRGMDLFAHSFGGVHIREWNRMDTHP